MMRILTVDSDSSSRAVVRNALADGLGATVTECADGGTALEAMTRHAYSLIVTELELPMMSGIEMLTIVRHQPRFRDIPAIVLTGKCHDPLVRRVISLGIGAYLIKPVNTALLCDRARALAIELALTTDTTLAAAAQRQLPRQGRILLPPLP